MIPYPFLDAAGTGPALFAAILFATFVSEDLTCLAAGLLVSAGSLHWFPAVAACFLGIAIGDGGIWLIGRIAGRRAARWSWVRNRLPDSQFMKLSIWLSRHGGKAAFASRFVPGTRVPLLLAAGVARRGGTRFLLWAVVAASIWAPLVVVSVAQFGAAVPGWIVLLGFGAVVLGLRLAPPLSTRIGRAHLAARVAKLWRWEFWPAWIFYLPLVPWFIYLSVRFRSFTVWTAANPGIPAGGVVGESKADILARLPHECIIPTLLIPTGGHDERVRLAQSGIENRGWDFPLVLKPDAGQRGAGVKKVLNEVDLEKYLLANRGPVIAQPYHPGPFEAGVFYYRMPDEEFGRIFSITDKVFPVIVGDGRSTLEELIWAHRRFRLQAAAFLARHQDDVDRVLGDGETMALAMAGNHCQGTLFRDGAHLLTPQLEAAIDGISKKFNGFFVGRFDVRYSDPSEFKDGRGFEIVELNGVTSESTNLYDPSWSMRRAYHTLFRQWSLLFRIGQSNRQRGTEPITVVGLFSLLNTYYRDRRVAALSD